MNKKSIALTSVDLAATKAPFGNLSTAAHSLLREAYTRFKNELGRFAVRNYGLPQDEAEDLVQSAFEKFASVDAPSAIENPRAFLYRLVNNLALNNFRHRAVEKKYAAACAANPNDEQASTADAPDRIVQQQQDLQLIAQQILTMPLRRRQIVVMNRFEHLSYAEIGRRLNISEAAVRKHIKRALEQITPHSSQVHRHD